MWHHAFIILYYLFSNELTHTQRPTSLRKILAMLKKIFQNSCPFSPPTPRSFPVLRSWTWQGYVKQILFYSLPTYFSILGSLFFNWTDSGLVVLFSALFQSLWMIWVRHNQAFKSWFPTGPRCSLTVFLRITFKVANTKWRRLLCKLKLTFHPWDRWSLKALLALEFYS